MSEFGGGLDGGVAPVRRWLWNFLGERVSVIRELGFRWVLSFLAPKVCILINFFV